MQLANSHARVQWIAGAIALLLIGWLLASQLLILTAPSTSAACSDPGCGAPPRKDSPGEANDFFVDQRTPPGMAFPSERYAKAIAKRTAMPQAHVRAKLGPRAWRSVGPPTVGGRTRALLIDPVEPDILYAAGASGGVWKSVDGAATWRSTGDAFANLATVTLAMDPADRRILFAGTGEGIYVNRPVTRSRGVRGDGIYVTFDGAQSWRQLASTAGKPDFDYVNKLLFDGDGRLHAATRAGLFVSTDRGGTWTRGFAPPNVEGCSELAWVPATRRMLASCGWFSQASLYASEDGGTSWRAIALLAGAGRTTLAVAPSNTAVVYALTAHHTDYNLLQLARSNDGGGTWQAVLARNGPDLISSLVLSNPIASVDEACMLSSFGALGQGWFDNVIAVDPRNPEIVFTGGVDLMRSDDGGRNFGIASRWHISGPNGVHADQHVLVFDPRYDGTTNRRLYAGNDGGVFVTQDARGPLSRSLCAETGGLVWAQRNQGYVVTQFYHGALSADGNQLIGGAQDNGTQMGNAAGSAWSEVFGGDGAYAAFDPRDPRRIYASTQNAGFVRSDNGGASFESIRTGLPPASANYLFIHPYIVDPNAPDVLWTGAGPRVYRSSNRGGTWTPVGAANIAPDGAKLAAIAVARGNSNRIVAGFDEGTVARSVDGGLTWSSVKPRSGTVSSLLFAPDDASTVYATYSTFGGIHVFVSRDGGASFAGLDGETAQFALPDVPAHVLLVDPRDRNRLWLGTDIGLFVSNDAGRRWYADASGLGNVLVEQLLATGTGDATELVAFTYGRGAFRARLADLAAPAVNPGYAGAFYEPATSGQGMQFEIVPQTGQLAVGWYTFGAAASGANHEWLVGTGALNGNTAEVSLFRVARGRFAASGAGAPVPAGSITLQFQDCSHVAASYSVSIGGTARQGELALERLGSSEACEAFRRLGDGALGALAVPGAAGDLEYGHGGSWLDAGAIAQGFVFELDPKSRIALASWYTFDPADADAAGERPTWYVAQGTLAGASAELTIYRSTGGAFDAVQPVTTEAVGSLRVTALGCAAMRAEYSLRLAGGEMRNGTFNLTRVA